MAKRSGSPAPKPPPQAERGAAGASPLLGELDLHLFNEGRHWHLADRLGAHACQLGGQDGARFAVWAPNARSAAVVGDFNGWDPQAHPLAPRGRSGIWEGFVAGAVIGQRYKYALVAGDGTPLPWKADPVGRRHEPPPATASVIPDES